MARTRQHVHMKNQPHGQDDGHFKLIRNGESCGGSVSREGVLTVLLSTLRFSAGEFIIVDNNTGDYLLEFDTDVPLWNGETVGEHVKKLPWAPRHEWQQALFFAGDEIDEEYCFSGWHRGERWNGWLDPWFARDQVDRIIVMLEEQGFDWDKHEGYKATWIRDTLIIEDANAEEVLVFHSKSVHISGMTSPIELYNLFGGGSFTWDTI